MVSSPRENRTPKSSLEGKHYIRLIIGPKIFVFPKCQDILSVTAKTASQSAQHPIRDSFC